MGRHYDAQAALDDAAWAATVQDEPASCCPDESGHSEAYDIERRLRFAFPRCGQRLIRVISFFVLTVHRADSDLPTGKRGVL